MQTELNPLVRINRFLSRELFYPLVLCTALSILLWMGQEYWQQREAYGFIPWNLMLAWIPYLLSVLVVLLDRALPGRWGVLAIPFFFWLVFFPNAPYVVTDLLHLEQRPGTPLWYDIGMFATFAWTGCFLALASLNSMHRIVNRYVGNLGSWLFVGGVLLLTGLGIYMGRFLNWNSWDLFLQPEMVLTDLVFRMIHPVRNARVYGVTGLFASFLLVCYLTFLSIQHREKPLPEK